MACSKPLRVVNRCADRCVCCSEGSTDRVGRWRGSLRTPPGGPALPCCLLAWQKTAPAEGLGPVLVSYPLDAEQCDLAPRQLVAAGRRRRDSAACPSPPVLYSPGPSTAAGLFARAGAT